MPPCHVWGTFILSRTHGALWVDWPLLGLHLNSRRAPWPAFPLGWTLDIEDARAACYIPTVVMDLEWDYWGHASMSLGPTPIGWAQEDGCSNLHSFDKSFIIYIKLCIYVYILTITNIKYFYQTLLLAASMLLLPLPPFLRLGLILTLYSRGWSWISLIILPLLPECWDHRLMPLS